MRLQTPAEHCPPFSPYKKEAVWMHDLSVGSFAQTRQPAKRCYGLSSSTATPGLAVKAGHLNNCASSCQMARPVLCFYRAINQSPGKREDLSQCAAIQLRLKPRSTPGFCVVRRWSTNIRREADAAATPAT